MRCYVETCWCTWQSIAATSVCLVELTQESATRAATPRATMLTEVMPAPLLGAAGVVATGVGEVGGAVRVAVVDEVCTLVMVPVVSVDEGGEPPMPPDDEGVPEAGGGAADVGGASVAGGAPVAGVSEGGAGVAADSVVGTEAGGATGVVAGVSTGVVTGVVAGADSVETVAGAVAGGAEVSQLVTVTVTGSAQDMSVVFNSRVWRDILPVRFIIIL